MGVFGYEEEHPITRQSLMSSKLRMCFKGTEIATGTGFFTQNEKDEIFLATNWHNVTGREPATYDYISSDAAIPDSLIVDCLNQRICRSVQLTIPLYNDDEMFEPRWLEHARWKEKVDVIIIPVTEEIQQAHTSQDCPLAILQRGDDEIQIEVGMDVSILGFPRGISAGLFPIWKRGAIASEPYQRIDELPKFYIDSATREGMSGSPVFACVSGPVRYEGTSLVAQSQGVVRRFLGVYSGRVGNDALGVQLGIVWKESVLSEILGFGIKGQSSVLLTAGRPQERN